MKDQQFKLAGALRRMMNQNTMYELSMSENEDVDVHYAGKLSCNARGNEFVLYDDSNDAVGIREGKARRGLSRWRCRCLARPPER